MGPEGIFVAVLRFAPSSVILHYRI